MNGLALVCLLSLPAGAQGVRRLAIPRSLEGFVLPAPPEPQAPAPAQAPVAARERFNLDLEHSRARFTLDSSLGEFSGAVLRFEAQAELDSASQNLASVAMTLDMTSVELDSQDIPKFLVHHFLKTGKYPTSEVRSVAVRPLSEGQASMDVEVLSKGEKYTETVVLTVERPDGGLRLTGTVHHTTPKGNKVVLDFDLRFAKAP